MIVNKYCLEKIIGQGTYGIVYQCVHTETNQTYAIKKLYKQYSSFSHCAELNEIKFLTQFKHSSLVHLEDVKFLIQAFHRKSLSLPRLRILPQQSLSILFTIQKNWHSNPRTNHRQNRLWNHSWNIIYSQLRLFS